MVGCYSVSNVPLQGHQMWKSVYMCMCAWVCVHPCARVCCTESETTNCLSELFPGVRLQGVGFSHKHHLSTTGSPASKHLAQGTRPCPLYIPPFLSASLPTHTQTHTRASLKVENNATCDFVNLTV